VEEVVRGQPDSAGVAAVLPGVLFGTGTEEGKIMFIYLSLLVMIIGGLIYFISTNAKWMELGRIMFFCGLLAFLLRGDAIMKLIGGDSSTTIVRER
jgi:hypothetical protein